MGLQYEPHVYTPMFPGRSCYPMSPSANARTAFDEREQHDQLNVIFEVIGTPSEDVIAAHPDAEVRRCLVGMLHRPDASHEGVSRCGNILLASHLSLMRSTSFSRMATLMHCTCSTGCSTLILTQGYQPIRHVHSIRICINHSSCGRLEVINRVDL